MKAKEISRSEGGKADEQQLPQGRQRHVCDDGHGANNICFDSRSFSLSVLDEID